MSFYRWDGEDLILQLHIQPRAARDEWVGPHGDRLKIRLTAPPVEGKANAGLCQFLATIFRVPKTQISVLAGQTGRDKRVRIHAPRQLPICIQFEQGASAP